MSFDEVAKNKRYMEIFKELVDAYIETGEPVGSRTLSKRIDQSLSPATIRNVMADLEELGLLCSAHTSSGRKPTEKGWRFFVNGLIEASEIREEDKKKLKTLKRHTNNVNIEAILERTTDILSDLSKNVSIIFRPTTNNPIRHIDFVLLSPGRAIVILVTSDGVVENRLIDVATDVSNSVLEKASKYLNTKLCGMTLSEIRRSVHDETIMYREGIDDLSSKIASAGISVIVDNDIGEKVIIRGQSNLLNNANEIEDLNKLLKTLDEKETLKTILDESINGKGMQIFIGSETDLFSFSGCSMIVQPYHGSDKKVIGAIGVVGPSRMRYSRMITLVDYTARILGNLV
jgi:heat-inducible transcriptional repressor